jgi:putative ATP-binding cassette transporter
MLATTWRLASPYFRSEDRFAGRLLLGSLIAIELSLVAINVLLNQWNNRFYNALQEHNWDTFITELMIFAALAAAYIALAVYRLYLNQWLQIRWRQWMNRIYLGQWLDHANHYRMQLLGDAADNPDQRIAEDIQIFVDRTLTIGVGLLGAVVTFFSFVVILWTLSAAAPLHLFGSEWNIPGYLVWAAVVYAVVGTALTHLIGWPLVGLNFMQQRYEADFRFNLVRVRENSEQIALLKGEDAEKQRLLDRFGRVVGNWMLIMTRTKKLTFFTAGYAQLSIIFPYVVVSPAYFAGKMQLGGLMQTASAFNSVQTALSFFIESYRSLAEWRSVVQRLEGFGQAVGAAQAATHSPPSIEIQSNGSVSAVELRKVAVNLPAGTPLLAADNIKLPRGEPVLLNGPSGAGKSTLFRAIAGIWPFGSGRIVLPKDARVMMLPQRPYFPVGSLAAAVTYPAEAGSYAREPMTEAIRAVGLPALAGRLEEEAHWNRMLSLGEQQRLGIARALLQKPDFLFLDEATASLDEPAEAALYHLLRERLPNATVISIGHRSTLVPFHRRQLVLKHEGDRFHVEEMVQKPAAE